MSMFWKEIARSQTEGELDSVWAEIERINHKSSKSGHDYTQLADLRNFAAELESNLRPERSKCCDESAFMRGFGLF